VVSGACCGADTRHGCLHRRHEPVPDEPAAQHGTDVPSTVVVHRSHRYDYDHAVRQAGAELREVGFPNLTFPYELEDAIRDDTVAVLYRGTVLGTLSP
jgi:hypothetical protein